MLQEKKWKRKKEISWVKNVQSVQGEPSCPCQGIALKKKMSEQLQVSVMPQFVIIALICNNCPNL